jgi:hypothetical protein
MNIGLFRPEEDNAIIKGVQELGDNPGRWADIKRMFPIELAQKSRSQIRERWRLMKQKLSITTQASVLSSTTTPFATTQSSAFVPALAQVPTVPLQPAAQDLTTPVPASTTKLEDNSNSESENEVGKCCIC